MVNFLLISIRRCSTIKNNDETINSFYKFLKRPTNFADTYNQRLHLLLVKFLSALNIFPMLETHGPSCESITA